MEQLTLVIVGGVMLGVALVALRWQLVRWRELEGTSSSSPTTLAEAEAAVDRLFYATQLRRRAQMSGMLAVAGLGIAASPLAPPDAQPSLFVFLWIGISLLACWLALLALVDLGAIRRHAARLTTRLLSQRGDLEAEVRRFEVKKKAEG